MSYIVKVLFNTLVFITLSVVFPTRFYVDSIFIAIAASLVLSVLDYLIKPILHFLSFPITFLTFGLFSFVINGSLLHLTSKIVGDNQFAFSSFGSAVLIAVIISLINALFGKKKSTW